MSDELTVEAGLAALEAANDSFYVKWSYSSRGYILTIPWKDLEFTGKTLLDVLRAFKQSQEQEQLK